MRGLPGEGSGELHILGNVMPKFRATWNNTVTYKRFTMYALVDGTFILVAETSNYSVGASGVFEKIGSTLRLRPDRWFTVHDGQAAYAREPVDATFDGKTLRLPD